MKHTALEADYYRRKSDRHAKSSSLLTLAVMLVIVGGFSLLGLAKLVAWMVGP